MNKSRYNVRHNLRVVKFERKVYNLEFIDFHLFYH